MNRVTTNRYFSLLLCIFILYVCACSSGPPVITQQFAAEVLRFDPQSSKNTISLGVFAVVDDPDGLNDIDRLWIINDQTQTLWELSPGNWESFVIQGKTWLGSTKLTMPVGEAIPRGNLRIQIEDRGGNRGEGVVALGQGSGVSIKSPRIKNVGDKLQISAEESDRIELSVKDWADAELGRYQVDSSEFLLKDVAAGKPLKDLRFYVYSFSPGMTRITVSGPWVLENGQ